MTTPNPWGQFLEEEPKAAYHSYRPQWGAAGSKQSGYYENQFSNLYDRYLGTLGAQARGGQEPTNQFNDDFLANYDWTGQYKQDVPYETRTQGQGGMAPRTRWMLPGQR